MTDQPDALRVEFDNGKYAIVEDHGRVMLLRHGELWENGPPFAKLFIAIAHEVDALRKRPAPPSALELARELETLGNELEAVGIVSNRLEKVRALLARPTAAPEDAPLPTQAWCFDMEKAPRDGTPILLHADYEDVTVVGFWGNGLMADGKTLAPKQKWRVQWDEFEFEPTHWMSLPAPPTPPAKEGQP